MARIRVKLWKQGIKTIGIRSSNDGADDDSSYYFDKYEGEINVLFARQTSKPFNNQNDDITTFIKRAGKRLVTCLYTCRYYLTYAVFSVIMISVECLI